MAEWKKLFCFLFKYGKKKLSDNNKLNKKSPLIGRKTKVLKCSENPFFSPEWIPKLILLCGSLPFAHYTPYSVCKVNTSFMRLSCWWRDRRYMVYGMWRGGLGLGRCHPTNQHSKFPLMNPLEQHRIVLVWAILQVFCFGMWIVVKQYVSIG